MGIRKKHKGEVFTTADVAKMMGCGPSTVARMIDDGHLPAYKAGNARRVTRSEVEKLLMRFHLPALSPLANRSLDG